MSTNNIHSVSNYVNSQNLGVTFQYDYERSFHDKVYASEVVDKTILSTCVSLRDIYNKKVQLSNDKLSSALIDELNLQLSQALKVTVKNTEFTKDPENNINDIWAISQSKNDIIPLHAGSATSEMSFILFASDFDKKYSPESGGFIEFISSKSNNTIRFNPEPGNIFIFDSSQLRIIYPHDELNPRTVVLGNIEKFEVHF